MSDMQGTNSWLHVRYAGHKIASLENMLIEVVLMWSLHDRIGDLGLRRHGVLGLDCRIG